MKSHFQNIVFTLLFFFFFVSNATNCDAYVLKTDLGVKLVLLDKIHTDVSTEADISSGIGESKNPVGTKSPNSSMSSQPTQTKQQTPN